METIELLEANFVTMEEQMILINATKLAEEMLLDGLVLKALQHLVHHAMRFVGTVELLAQKLVMTGLLLILR